MVDTAILSALDERQRAFDDTLMRIQFAIVGLALGFFGMLRRSELAGLSVGDVQLLPGGDVQLLVARSKTDQQGPGATVVLAETANPLVFLPF